LIFSALAILIASISLSSCKKKYPTDTTAAEDDANASITMQDTKNILDAAVNGHVIAQCATITKRDTNSGIDSLLDINFGPADCTGAPDKRARRGQILVWYLPGTYFNQGSIINMAFKNYFLSDIGVAGAATITNTGVDSANIHSWSYNANLTLSYPSSNATWNSQRSCALVKVGGIFYYSITGSANGRSRSSATYTLNITSPVYATAVPYPIGCQYFEAGQISFTVSTFSYSERSSSFSMNSVFGTSVGSCGNTAQATISGSQYPFNQP